MIKHLEITELPASKNRIPPSECSCQISIKITSSDSHHCFDIHLSNPLTGKDPASEPPNNTTPEVSPYGKKLVSQFAQNTDLYAYIHPASTLVFEIVSKPTDKLLSNIFWEALEDKSSWTDVGGKPAPEHVFVIRTTGADTDIPHLPLRNGFKNILFVSSNPDAVVKQTWDLEESAKPNLVICKEASWKEVKGALKDHGKGYFDVVHLDISTEIHASSTILGFSNGDLREKVDGELIAKELGNADVQNIILNTPVANSVLPASLISNGAKVVVGIPITLSPSAKEAFVKGLYGRMLVHRCSAEQAALYARAHLWKSRGREWKFEEAADGKDLIVPVVYCCCGIDLVEEILAENGARKVHFDGERVANEEVSGEETVFHGLLHQLSSFWRPRHG